MRLRKTTLGILVNFLLGVAWAFVLIGAFYTFIYYYHISFFDAVLMTFLGMLPGLFLVVVLEYFIVGIERLDELKKQTALLKKISENNSDIQSWKKPEGQ